MPDLNYRNLIKKHQWLVFEEQVNPLKDQESVALAYQESFLRYLLQLNNQDHLNKPYGILHFYPIFKPSVFLGAKDKLLNNFSAGVAFLEREGYTLSIRPHGGLGVVEDDGILNFAIVTDNRFVSLNIDQAFNFSLSTIQSSLNKYNLTLSAYEITDSYCPGKYDVVIDGKKVGGIAQRRYRDAVTTAAYIGISGDQIKRGQIMQGFYQIAQADDRFPQVNPHSMATLSDILGQPISLADFQAHFIECLHKESQIHPGRYQDPNLQEIFHPLLIKAQQRSQKIYN